MKERHDRYAILDRERMPWGKYAGRRISELSVDYCKFALTSVDQLNPLLRDLLKLRIDKEKNWLKDLKQQLAHYESVANENDARAKHFEVECERYREQVHRMQAEGWANTRTQAIPCLRTLRRRFAARYHPDAEGGSTATMALVNQIFNELERELIADERVAD
ncbi:MAG: hypothetical protein AAFX06_09440 [Planctomycetota bacterium]